MRRKIKCLNLSYGVANSQGQTPTLNKCFIRLNLNAINALYVKSEHLNFDRIKSKLIKIVYYKY